MSKPIRKRSEVAAEFTWDLTDIFPSDEAWRAEYEALKPYAEAVAAYRGRLGESAETLLAYFRLDDELNVRVGRLYSYANCKADEDTSNGFYQDLRGKALSLSVTLSGAGAFAASELLALSNKTLTRFYAEQPELATYRRPIERVRRRRAHILSPECEALLAAMRLRPTTPRSAAIAIRSPRRLTRSSSSSAFLRTRAGTPPRSMPRSTRPRCR